MQLVMTLLWQVLLLSGVQLRPMLSGTLQTMICRMFVVCYVAMLTDIVHYYGDLSITGLPLRSQRCYVVSGQ
jgi:hypothetical protein